MYLDANFFVFSITVGEKQGKAAREIALEIVNGKKAVTSSLALDEVMWVLIKNNMKELVRDTIEEIYAIENIEVKEVPSLIPLRALDFMEKHNLKPRDAFHLAIMEHLGIKEIVTDDKNFDKIPGIKRIKL